MGRIEQQRGDGAGVERTQTATGIVRIMASAIMAEARRYWVYLPPSYHDEAAAERRYPVVVHLDGQSHGDWSPTTVEYMIRRRRVPEVIVVGVYNTDQENRLSPVERARDLTPTHSLIHHDGTQNECYRLSGGADRFSNFLEQELLPTVDETYRTLPRRVIVGQSLSGCFVLDAFLTGQSAFQAFVAMDPCLWWDGDRAKHLTAELEPGSAIFERALFVAFSGTDEANRVMQQAWFDQLGGKAAEPDRRHLRFAHYPEESHISMNLKGFYDGLGFLLGERCGLDWGGQS
jgi:predicted alpha/beta superfamily hydrolase